MVVHGVQRKTGIEGGLYSGRAGFKGPLTIKKKKMKF